MSYLLIALFLGHSIWIGDHDIAFLLMSTPFGHA